MQQAGQQGQHREHATEDNVTAHQSCMPMKTLRSLSLQRQPVAVTQTVAPGKVLAVSSLQYPSMCCCQGQSLAAGIPQLLKGSK